MPPDRTPSPARLPLDATRADLMLRAAKLYYELDRTRSQIAAELGLTRWQVSRLLADGRAQGIVRIEIAPRDGRRADLELRLHRELGLADAVVVPVVPGADPETLRMAVGQAAARYLAALAPRPGLIGVSWGRSMAEVARALPPGWNPGARIVLVNGATTLRSASPRTSAVAEEFAASAGGEAVLLPLPAIFGQRATRLALERDPVIAPVLALAAQAEVVCFGMGGLSRGSALVNSGYLDEDDIDRLRAAGAVGDILGRYVDAGGRIVDPALDARTIGLELDALRGKRLAIGVVSGAEKQAVARAAVRAGYVSTLVTDAATAEALLQGQDTEISDDEREGG